MNLESKRAASELWIGAPPSSLQIGVIMTVSIMGAIMPSLLPILLGGLLQEHRLTASLMGQTATIELLAIGVVSGMAGAWLPHRHLRQIGFLAGILLVAANVATMFLSGAPILAVRALSGMCCGLYLWVIVGMFIRSKVAARWIGIYTLLLGVAALALSSLFSAILVPRYGINGAFAGMAAISGFVALASLLLPTAYASLGDSAVSGSRMPPSSGVLALLMQFIYTAGLLAVWVYVGTMSLQNGNSAADTAFAFSLAFAMQIVGGGAASALANRLSALPVIVVSGSISIALAATIAGGASGNSYIACIALFGGLWMFAAPYLLPFTIGVDPTLKSALLGTSAQLIGCAAGPALASMTISDTNVSGALWIGVALFATAIVLALFANVAGKGLQKATV